jgi:predicted kinase
MLVIMAGLPGTGKTHVAQALARPLDAILLSKDVARHALFGPDLVEYSTEQDDFVIDVLLRTAESIWRKRPKKTIILDGRTFSRESQRKYVIDFVEGAGQKWKILECICAEVIAKQRLATPDPSHPAANRTPALYDEVKSRWEPILEPHITLQTDVVEDYSFLSYELS